MSRQGTERTKRRRAIRDYHREGPGADDAVAGTLERAGQSWTDGASLILSHRCESLVAASLTFA